MNYSVTNNLPLDELISKALCQLQELNYSVRTVRRYQTVWRRLVLFAEQYQFDNKLSEDLIEQFLGQYSVQYGQSIPKEETWRKHAVFSIKILSNFSRYRRIERHMIDIHRHSVPSTMKKTLYEYAQYCREKRHLRDSTTESRFREISLFLDFLGKRNIKIFNQIQAIDLSEFVTSRQCFKPKTISRIVSDIRMFLQFLVLRGLIKIDLTRHLPTIHISQNATIPSVWDQALVAKLLNAVDRSSPRGKRDYAILLLAYQLGLRISDIRVLTLDHINWEAATISIIQSKTQTPLCLPLTDEVGNALIDYLSSARPNTSYREIFLKLTPPFVPLSKNSHHIVTFWRELAGIKFRSKQHHGMHSLRHSLATHLLEKGTPFPVVADILGHTSMTSTLIYAKTNVEALRQVALSFEEVNHVN
jgi:site-specific recombinase XerD